MRLGSIFVRRRLIVVNSVFSGRSGESLSRVLKHFDKFEPNIQLEKRSRRRDKAGKSRLPGLRRRKMKYWCLEAVSVI